MMDLGPSHDAATTAVEGHLTSRAAAALFLAALATATELLALFWGIVIQAFPVSFRDGVTGRLLPLLLSIGISAAASTAVINGIRGAERGRGVGYLVAIAAVPFVLAGLLALYVTLAI